jgi:hypothetical protein
MPIKMFQETAKVLLALMIDWLASAGEELPGGKACSFRGFPMQGLPLLTKEWPPHGKF